MIKLKPLLRESKEWSDITIKDVEGRLSSRFIDREYASTLRTIENFYYSDDEENRKAILGYLSLLNIVGKQALQLTSQIPYVDVGWIKQYLLSQSEFKTKEEEFFPFPVYVAANADEFGDYNTIGILIDQHGKALEIHEGNDEATSETINMVNKMVIPQGKKVRIYACHNSKLVRQIEISEYLPKDLYVSPYRNHASGYMDLHGERSMFTGIIDISYVNQESDLDWRTLDKTKIEKFRWL